MSGCIQYTRRGDERNPVISNEIFDDHVCRILLELVTYFSLVNLATSGTCSRWEFQFLLLTCSRDNPPACLPSALALLNLNSCRLIFV